METKEETSKRILMDYNEGLNYLIGDPENFEAISNAEIKVGRYLLIEQLKENISSLENGANPYDYDSEIGRKIYKDVLREQKLKGDALDEMGTSL